MNQIVTNSLKVLDDVKHFNENVTDEIYQLFLNTEQGETSLGSFTSEILSYFLYFLKGQRKGYMFYRLQQLNPIFKTSRTASLFCISRLKEELEKINLHKEIKISFVPKDELASNVTSKASMELQKLNTDFFRILSTVKSIINNHYPEIKLPGNFANPAEVKFLERRKIVG